MLNSSRWSIAGVTLLTLGLAAAAMTPLLPSASPVSAAPDTTGNFPDTRNHWAQPFIQVLAEKNIVSGYLDNTYRPDRPVAREEYAAMIRKAFNQQRNRRIPHPSIAYKDVPPRYWAASAIEEAYESGFMNGYPGGYFRPKQNISRAEALVSLTKNLDLRRATAAATQAATSSANATQAAAPQTTTQAAVQPATQRTTRRNARRQFLFPLAAATLVQPLITASAQAKALAGLPSNASSGQNTTASPASAPATNNTRPTQAAPATTVNNYYIDAEKIPQYAVAPVGAATQAGLVVNHPNLRVLNPNRPATRGEIAAFIHQALVSQRYLSPLPANVSASNYIVDRDQISARQPQP